MFDSHCHLYDFADADVIVANAKRQGLVQMLLAGENPRTWALQQALVEKYPQFLVSALGWHPWQCATKRVDDAARDLERLAAAIATAQNVVALGEVGLDKLRGNLTVQTIYMQKQLALANQLGLPLVLHIVGAQGDALALLQETPPQHGGVVHSFSGSKEMMSAYVALGLSISFSATVLDPRRKKLREAARACDNAALLVETDAPHQAPPNTTQWTPGGVADVLAGLAALRGQSLASLSELTCRNACRLFALQPPQNP